MKITIIGPSHPYRGGIALFSNRLAQALVDCNHEVKILTFKLQYPNFLFPGKTQFTEDEDPPNVRVERCINSINPINWYKVGRKVLKDRPDVVIFKYWMPFMAPCFGTIARVLRNDKTKILSLVHNLIPHERHIGDDMLTGYFVRGIDGFITMSAKVMDDIDQLDQVKPKIFSPHPLYDNFGTIKTKSEALNDLGLDPSFRYLLFFGIIRNYKGLDLLLEAFSNEKIDKKSVKLIVAGEFYDDRTPYLDIIRKNRLEKSVILVEQFIPNSQVVNYFCVADMIVQPYRNATQSGVTQIAYHFERPMLVTDVGGLKEIVPHLKVGYVINPNKDEITKSIVDFYENKREEEFIKGIQEEKQKYSWDNTVDAIISLTKDIKRDK